MESEELTESSKLALGFERKRAHNRKFSFSVFPAYVLPELDTVRVYWLCNGVFDVLRFFFEHVKKEEDVTNGLGKISSVMSVQKCGDKYVTVWEADRIEMHQSWWCKMSVTRQFYKVNKWKNKVGIPCLCFEFSVAKWYGISNGFNRNVPASYHDIISPIMDVILHSSICKYILFPRSLKTSFEGYLRHLLDTQCVLRRMDLSYNFKIQNTKKQSVSDYIDFLSSCRLTTHSAVDFKARYGEDFGNIVGNKETVEWGSKNSCYHVKFYDKYIEQCRRFSECLDNDANITKTKREWWKAHKEQQKNTLRFEVEFSRIFFRVNHLPEVGHMDKIIDLSVLQWREILHQFDVALNRRNFQAKEGVKPLDLTLGDLEFMLRGDLISTQKQAFIQSFLVNCYRKGWRNVYDSMSRQNFYNYSKFCRDRLNFDVKQGTPDRSPIRGIIVNQVSDSAQSKIFRLCSNY